MLDAIVIGGGPAGLQAALTLGRMHRRVVLLDSGAYRNAPVGQLHNFATHDGRPPSEFRDLARRDLAEYPTVEVRDAAVTSVEPTEAGFRVHVSDGAIEARAVVLATGLRDELPDIPGVAEAWGREIAHCPYCHGHEFAGRRIVLMLEGDHLARFTAMLGRIGAEIVPLEAAVTAVERVDGGLRVHRAAGSPLDVDGMFVATRTTQAAPFAEQLGAEILADGCVAVDASGRTSVPGLYAAGDLAHLADLPGQRSAVLAAAAAGLVASSTVDHDLLALEAGQPGKP